MPRAVAASKGYARRVRESFARQEVMKLFGASLGRIEPGLVEIELAHRREFVQQDGYLHAGVLSTIADSAGGYAAYTMAPPSFRVLTVEYKMNFLAPAVGDLFLARGRVIRAGKRIAVCQLEVEAVRNGKRTLCAVGMQTIAYVAAEKRLAV